MTEHKKEFKGNGKHLTEERNLGEAEIIQGDRYEKALRVMPDIFTVNIKDKTCRLSENYRRIWYKSAICGIINI